MNNFFLINELINQLIWEKGKKNKHNNKQHNTSYRVFFSSPINNLNIWKYNWLRTILFFYLCILYVIHFLPQHFDVKVPISFVAKLKLLNHDPSYRVYSFMNFFSIDNESNFDIIPPLFLSCSPFPHPFNPKKKSQAESSWVILRPNIWTILANPTELFIQDFPHL